MTAKKTRLNRNKLILGVILVVFGGLALFSLYKFSSFFAFLFVFPWLTEYLEIHAAIDPWQAKLIAFLPAVFIVIGIGMFFSLRKEKRIIGIVMASVGYLSFCGFMYYADNHYPFNPATGESNTCYVNNLNGYSAVPCSWEVDPQTGNPVIKDPEEVKNIARIIGQKATGSTEARSIKTTPSTRFFGNDGKPLIWYSERPAGNFYFASEPGFDPQFQIELKPITSEIVHRFHYPESYKKIPKATFAPGTPNTTRPGPRSEYGTALEDFRNYWQVKQQELKDGPYDY